MIKASFFKRMMAFFRRLLGDVQMPTPQPTTPVNMNRPEKYAVLVGINHYGVPNADLRGCVNDVINMRDVLTQLYGFDPENIRVLTDSRATRAAILHRLDWLVEKSNPNVQAVFHYSGHGSQIRDRSGDELDDSLDELICPHDMNWDNPLTDDDLAQRFREIHKRKGFITFLCDACHSGTMDRGHIGNPHETKPRFLEPPFDIAARSTGIELPVNRLGRVGTERTRAANDVNKTSNQSHMLFSGCRDNQTSADAYIGGKYQGAMTAHLIEAINKMPHASWLEIHQNVVGELMAHGFTQVPQLSGPVSVLENNPFGR